MTVVAAAIAIDAMYVKVGDLLDAPIRGRNRQATIIATFESALALGARTGAWQASIPKLFDLRDNAAHFRGEATAGLAHPIGMVVGQETAIYTAEAGSMAVDFALEVLTVAHRAPRRCHRRLVKWAERDAHMPGHFEAVRRGEAL